MNNLIGVLINSILISTLCVGIILLELVIHPKNLPLWRGGLWLSCFLVIAYIILLWSRRNNKSTISFSKVLLYGEGISIVLGLVTLLFFPNQIMLAVYIGLFLLPVSIFSQYISTKQSFVTLYSIHSVILILSLLFVNLL